MYAICSDSLKLLEDGVSRYNHTQKTPMWPKSLRYIHVEIIVIIGVPICVMQFRHFGSCGNSRLILLGASLITVVAPHSQSIGWTSKTLSDISAMFVLLLSIFTFEMLAWSVPR